MPINDNLNTAQARSASHGAEHGGHTNIPAIGGAVAGGAVLVILTAVAGFVLYQRRKQQARHRLSAAGAKMAIVAELSADSEKPLEIGSNAHKAELDVSETHVHAELDSEEVRND